MKIRAKDGKLCQNWKVRIVALPESRLSVYFSTHLSTEHFKKAGGFFLPKGNGCAVAAVCKKRKSRVSPFLKRSNLLRMTPFKRSVYSADDCSLLSANASLAAFDKERLFYKWRRPSVSLRRSRKLFNTPGRYFVKSPHCLEKTSSLKRISNAKFSPSFLSSRRPCFSQNSCLPALLPFSSNARLLPTLLSFFRAPECALFSYLFFKALLPSRRPRLPGAAPSFLSLPLHSRCPCLLAAPAAFLSCRYPYILAASRRPCPLAPSSSLSPHLFSRREKSIFSFIE